MSSSVEPFSVPTTLTESVPKLEPIVVPDVVNGGVIKDVEPWVYKKFSPVDVIYSRFGIASITSIVSFFILSYMNPVFVQECSDENNRIERMKPCVTTLYVISVVVFLFIMFVPIQKL